MSRCLRLLLAEDNIIDQRVAVRLLEKRGRAHTEANIAAAIRTSLSGQFQLPLVTYRSQQDGDDGG